MTMHDHRLTAAPREYGRKEAGAGDDQREIRDLSVKLKEATDQVKQFATDVKAKMDAGQAITDELKQKCDKALTDMNDVSARLTDVEQKLARRPGGSGPEAIKSPGQIFVESEGFKAAAPRGDSFKGSVSVQVKNITSASASGASASTALVPADRQPGIIAIPNRPMTIRDLLTPGRTVLSSIEYTKESVFTNAAATVAEGSLKPQSDITYTLVTTGVKTIAHWIKASKQILADAPQLQSQIDGRLRYGLDYVEEVQLLNGDGTGSNLLGLMPQATAYVQPTGVSVTGETMIDRLRLAMLQATMALFPATGHVLNPIDWASIEMKKDAGGNYIFANPTALAGPTLWGLPVAVSLAQAQNNFLTGALKYAAQIFDRDDAEVMLSTEDQDNFVRNMVTVLAEERLALAVYRPAALIKGTFTGAA